MYLTGYSINRITFSFRVTAGLQVYRNLRFRTCNKVSSSGDIQGYGNLRIGTLLTGSSSREG